MKTVLSHARQCVSTGIGSTGATHSYRLSGATTGIDRTPTIIYTRHVKPYKCFITSLLTSSSTSVIYCGGAGIRCLFREQHHNEIVSEAGTRLYRNIRVFRFVYFLHDSFLFAQRPRTTGRTRSCSSQRRPLLTRKANMPNQLCPM